MFNNTSSCRVKLGIIVRVEQQRLKTNVQKDITVLQIPGTQRHAQKETTARQAHQHQFHAKQGFTALLYLKITFNAWRGIIALQVHLHKFRVQETHIQPLNHLYVHASHPFTEQQQAQLQPIA